MVDNILIINNFILKRRFKTHYHLENRKILYNIVSFENIFELCFEELCVVVFLKKV